MNTNTKIFTAVRAKSGAFLLPILILASIALAWRFLPGLAQPEAPQISLAAGNGATCVLVDGGLRCWGTAASTGTGSTHSLPTPGWAFGMKTGVASVDLGSLFGCAVMTSGAAKCWGDNTMGQLGDGTTQGSLTPVNVVGLPTLVKQIATGYTHSCALLTNGQVWCWGNNANYQLGRTGSGSGTPTQVESPFAGAVRSLTAGGAHTCALLENGAVQCWGYGYYGSLGNGTSGNEADTAIPQNVLGLSGKVTQLKAGYYHTCALLEGGAIQCWGLFGNFSQTQATAVAGFGSGNTSLAANGGHVCVLDAARKAYCQGEGTAGQLGNGSKVDSGTPVEVSGLASGVGSLAAGNGHTCAVWGGQVYCWGGTLGAGASTFTAYPWYIFGLPSSVQQLAGSSIHACAVANGAAYCWGGNLNGALGIGVSDWQTYSTPQAVLDAASGATNISAGIQYTCAVINGAAKCWGRNEYGQLGNGTQTEANRPAQVSGLTSGVSRVFANSAGGGQSHTCAIVNGAAYCWGGNYGAQLGSGSVTNIELTPLPVVGLTSGVTSMALGDSHTCATVNGAAKCWGFGYYGEIGNGVSGTYDKYPTPQDVTNLASGVTQVAAGDYFTCALVNNGVKCWGRNDAGQLGDGTTTNRSTPVQVNGLASGVTAITAGSKYACALAGGAVKCWGAAPTGTSNTPQTLPGLESILEISAGAASLLVRTADGASALGENNYSALGSPVEYSLVTPRRLLGFSPSAELRLQTALAQPGSTLHIAGGSFPASTRLPVRLNGRDLGSVFSDARGYFSLVLDTQGQPAGAYTLQVLANGMPVEASFNLDAAAPLVQANNGGVYFGMAAAVANPTPRPSPTPNPNATPTPAPALQVDQVAPNKGDRAIPVRVDIYGSNFQPGAVARLTRSGSDIPALETLYLSSGHLQATWPGGLQTEIYSVVVYNPDWSKAALVDAYLPVEVVSSPGDDLYGFDYELGAATNDLQPGANVGFWFVLRRLGGAGVLNNVKIRFYWGDEQVTNPVTQGVYMGQANIAAIAPNQWAQATINYLAPAAGTYQLFAVIDPGNQVIEVNEANNIVHSWFTVTAPPPAPPADSVPPVVDSVSAGSLWTNSSYATLTVSAHDNPGGSGVAWVYIFTWEYFPGLRDWIVTDDSGWMAYPSGAASQSYGFDLGYFEGPRFFEVYVADQAENVSADSGFAILNYIKPGNFIFPGESHLFAFPFLGGDPFKASLRNEYPDNDADLYLWPPDYPGRAYWASATPGSASETLNINIPVDGWYWLEVYGYDFSYYDLTLELSALGNFADIDSLPVLPDGIRPRTTPLALAEDQPSRMAVLPAIPVQVFLPLLRK